MLTVEFTSFDGHSKANVGWFPGSSVASLTQSACAALKVNSTGVRIISECGVPLQPNDRFPIEMKTASLSLEHSNENSHLHENPVECTSPLAAETAFQVFFSSSFFSHAAAEEISVAQPQL